MLGFRGAPSASRSGLFQHRRFARPRSGSHRSAASSSTRHPSWSRLTVASSACRPSRRADVPGRHIVPATVSFPRRRSSPSSE
jgi:hypothetical protein